MLSAFLNENIDASGNKTTLYLTMSINSIERKIRKSITKPLIDEHESDIKLMEMHDHCADVI